MALNRNVWRWESGGRHIFDDWRFSWKPRSSRVSASSRTSCYFCYIVKVFKKSLNPEKNKKKSKGTEFRLKYDQFSAQRGKHNPDMGCVYFLQLPEGLNLENEQVNPF